MIWKVYATRKDYEASDGGTRPTHAATEAGLEWGPAPGGVWAVPEGATVAVWVRKRPGKGKPFWYRIAGEAAPRPPGPPKPPKDMEPLFELG